MTRSDIKLEGGEEEKYGRKKKSRDVGKEALNNDDKNDGQGDRKRRIRGDGKTSDHPLLSLSLSPYSLFLSPFLIIRYFVLYSQVMWRGLSLLFWIQALKQVIFQGSQPLNEAI